LLFVTWRVTFSSLSFHAPRPCMLSRRADAVQPLLPSIPLYL
jgi:hypothetical protein